MSELSLMKDFNEWLISIREGEDELGKLKEEYDTLNNMAEGEYTQMRICKEVIDFLEYASIDATMIINECKNHKAKSNDLYKKVIEIRTQLEMKFLNRNRTVSIWLNDFINEPIKMIDNHMAYKISRENSNTKF